MIDIGKVSDFVVSRESSSGFFLRLIDSESTDEEVFLPPAMGPLKLSVNDKIAAFTYLDSTGGLIATTQIPYAAVGEYALMTVIDDSQEFGAFFDWGIDKDLLVPRNEQVIKVRANEDYLVRVCLEEGTDRVFGTTKLGKYIEDSEFDINEGEFVEIIPAIESELGYRSIINKKFVGMIYQNEVFIDVRIGEKYQGVVKKIRVDGLVDVALQAHGIKNLVAAKEVIVGMLSEYSDGKSSLHDKSSPEAIKQLLGMSKKTFKSAIGMLYKDGTILIYKDGIELAKK